MATAKRSSLQATRAATKSTSLRRASAKQARRTTTSQQGQRAAANQTAKSTAKRASKTPSKRASKSTAQRTTKTPSKRASKSTTKRATKAVTKRAANAPSSRGRQVTRRASKRTTKSVAKSAAKPTTKTNARQASAKRSATPSATAPHRQGNSRNTPNARSTTTKRRAAKQAGTQPDGLTQDALVSASTTTDTVTLPATWALRVLEKAAAWQARLEQDFSPVVHRVIYVSAVCFTLVGLALIVFPAVPTMNGSGLTAQLPSATSPTQDQIDFQLTTTIPAQITAAYPVTFQADPSQTLRATLRTVSGVRIPLTIDTVEAGLYSVTIPSGVPADYYRLYFTRTTLTDDYAPIYRSREFFITNPPTTTSSTANEQTDATGTETSDVTATTTTDTPTTVDSVRDDASDETTLDTTATADPTPEPDSLLATTSDRVQDVVDATTDDAANEDVTDQVDDQARATTATQSPDRTATDEDPDARPATAAATVPQFTFAPYRSTVLRGTVTLSLNTTAAIKEIELLARPARSLTAQHVTVARQRASGWVFAFDSTTLPNGTYEFVAYATLADGSSRSTSIRLTVQNPVPRLNDTPSLEASRVESADRVLDRSSRAAGEQTTTRSTSTRPRIEVPVEPTRTTLASSSLLSQPGTSTPLLRASSSRDIIAANRTRLNELLERYAAITQTENEVALEAVRRSLAEERERMLATALEEDSLTERVDIVAADLQTFTSEMQRRIDAFETLRRERSAGDASVDTDGDGIADYDERVLYQTDPLAADTDGDGVTDGIEVSRGFDPRSTTTETLVRFESPRNTVGLERPEALRIDRVQPVVTPGSPERPSETAAKIEGTALPHSFVRLYIFSAPTVVTVQTDADGSFVYTFEKELVDGEHEVYVAITDNAGTIIAQSEPFRFVKEAEAFIPAASTPAGLGDTAAIEPPPPAYHTAAGAGMIALGAILVVLGMAFRLTRRSDTDVEGTILNDRAITF